MAKSKPGGNGALTAGSKRSRRRRPAFYRARDRDMVDAFTLGRIGLRHSDYRSDIRRVERWVQSWVYICIERNATAVTQQICRLYYRGEPETPRATKRIPPRRFDYLKAAYAAQVTPKTVEVSEHPFLNLLERPNPILDRAGLYWLTVAYVQSTGAAYWHMTFGPDGTPIELWPLPAQYVTPIFGAESVIDEYEFRMGSKFQRFPRSSIVHFRRPSPIDTISGFGNLRGVLETGETDIRMMEYERAVFDNMAVPDILISAKGDTTSQQIETLQTNWEHEYKGHTRRGKAAAVPFPIDVTQLSFKNRDLEFDKGSIRIRDKIAAGFGVPIPILTSTSTTFSNMDIGVQLWMRNQIQPLLVLIAATINHTIMPLYSPTKEDVDEELVPDRTPWFVAWDNPVPEDLTSQTERDIADVGAGIRTINEVRHGRNLDPVPWGDEPWITSGFTTPSLIAQEQEFNQQMQRIATERDGETVETPAASFSELTTALDLMSRIGDLDGVNLIRRRIAEQLGDSLRPINELAPAPSAAIVEPEDAAPRPGSTEVEQEEGQEQETEETEDDATRTPQGQQEQKDAGTGSDDEGATGSGETVATATTSRTPATDGTKRDGDDQQNDHPAGDGRGGGAKADENPGAASEQHDRLRQNVQDRRRRLDQSAECYNKLARELFEPEERDKSLEYALNMFFREFEAEVTEKLAELVNEKALKTDTLIRKLVDAAKWVGKLRAIVLPALSAAFKRGATLGAEELKQTAGAPGAVLPDDKLMERHVRKLAQTFASKTVAITGEQLAETLLPGITEGENLAQLVQRLKNVYGEKQERQLTVITRTEVNTALNAGAAETFELSGVEEHEWLASTDACEFCRALDGRIAKIGTPFVPLGGAIKGMQGGTYKIRYRPIMHPTLHPNCTCTIVAVVD